MMAEGHIKGTRVGSIDVMRSLTMLLMLFVNDIPGTKGVPHWLFHAAYNEDMLGFSDTIFPAFLFCVGLSVPLSIDRRLGRGDTQFSVLCHILWRSFALVVMGLFTMNGDEGAGGIPHLWYALMMVGAFFLVWTDYEGLHVSMSHRLTATLKMAGGLLMAGVVVWCDVAGKPFHTGWWGILGLIGWSYLVCALVYLFLKGQEKALLAVWILGVVFCMLSQSSLLPREWFCRCILLPFLPGGWTGHALCLSGMVATLMMRRLAGNAERLWLTALFLGIGLLMLGLGFWAHHHWIISKIQATPTWLFFCLAIYFPLMALLWWVVDVRGKAGWFRLIRPAGTATLTCYLLPYLWYPLRGLVGIHFPWGWYNGVSGLLLSLLYAIAIIQVARLMEKVGWRIKV